MEFYILLFCVSIILLCIAPLFTRKTSKRLPPGPSGLPILGVLPYLGPLPHQKLAQWAKEFGPLITVHFGFNTTIVASTAESARDILQKNDNAFCYRPDVDVMSAVPHAEGLIGWVTADQNWRNKRRICSNNLFTARQVESHQYLCDQKIEQLITHVQKHCDRGSEVDFGQLAFATILNFVSNSIFSIDIVDPKFESAGKFKELIWRIMELAGKTNISDAFPILRKLDLQGLRRHVMHSYLSLFEIFDELIEQRLKARASGPEGRANDFLDVLLDESQKEGSIFDRQTIKALILELFFAGSDTSSITTEWAMAELLHNPEMMKRAQKELREVLGDDVKILKPSDIERLPYLQAIVKETLRLHPSGPMLLPHMAGCDVEIKGYTIKQGTQVLINAWAISRDPKYWEDPLAFKPERFLNSNIDFKGKDFEYIPFGAGRRICPGWPLANRMVSTILAAMIHSFNWELPDGITPQTLDMSEKFGITLRKNVALRAIPTPK